MYDINNKIAIVTGGASGIGLAIVNELLENGLKAVTIVDVNGESGENVLKKLTNQYGKNRAIFVKADVSKKGDFEEIFVKTISAFKNVDILINNAGVNDELLENTVGVNLNAVITGTLLATEKYLPKYKSSSEGVVFNVASAGGLMALPDAPIYCATKHAVVGFGISLGNKGYYEKTKTKIVTFCPGFTRTPLVKNMKAGSEGQGPQEPEFVAKAAVRIIQEGNNGSLWVVRKNEVYEAEFPNISKMRKIK